MPTTPTSSKRIFLTAAWRHLAVLNYEVDPALLAAYVPPGTALDFDDGGKTYVSLVGFVFEETRVLGWQIPWHVNFEELNLRFYVKREEPHETRRGVVFIKELVPRAAISFVARWGYNENYHTVPMRHTIVPGDVARGIAPDVKYEFKHAGCWHRIAVACDALPLMPTNDSHEAFILEHYWGYCRQRDGGTIEYRVDHPRWNVWPARNVQTDCDFAALYGETFGEVLARKPTSAFVADGSMISVARPKRIAIPKALNATKETEGTDRTLIDANRH